MFKRFTTLFFIMFVLIFDLCIYANNYVIYSNSSGIYRMNNDGTGAVNIYTPASGFIVYSIAVDASESKLYFYLDNSGYTAGEIYRCNLDGNALESFLDVSGTQGVDGMAAGGGYLYYTPYTTKKLLKIKSDKSTTDDLYTATYLVDYVALDLANGWVYFVDFGAPYYLYRINITGGSTSPIHTGGATNGVYYVSAGNGHVFFTTGGNPSFDIFRKDNSESYATLHSVFTPPSATGAPRATAYDADNGNLYFVHYGDIYKGGSDGTSGSVIKSTGDVNTNLVAAAPNTIMPVELTSFSALTHNNSVTLNWKTATEVNNFGFEVERASSQTSPGQEDWTKIGFIKGNGNSNSPKNYIYIDNSDLSSSKYSYRLKQIDNDGQFEYSNVVEVSFNKLTEFSLQQNYPNPFNPSTTISYSLPEKAQVRLIVYDVIGREVANLVNKEEESGTYNVKFDASKLNSGIYFYKLNAGSFSEVKKLMLVK